MCIGMGFFTGDGTLEKYEPGPIDDVHHGYWKTDAGHPASTAQIACLAMLIHELGYDDDAADVGARLLENITEAHTGKRFAYTSAEQMPPESREKPAQESLTRAPPCFGLDAYWRGKLHGVL